MMTQPATPAVLHVRSEDMVFAPMHPGAEGQASDCPLIGPDISNTTGAGAAVYDGCSIESSGRYDEASIVLSGALRLRTGEGFSQLIEANFGDVIWIRKGTRVKYEGDKAKVFYVRFPVDWRNRRDAGELPPATEVYHFRNTDMIFSQIQVHSGGYASTCWLISPAISKSVSGTVALYDGCSMAWTTRYDQASVGLGGNMRILYGEKYDRAIEAKLGDVVWLPKGTPVKYEGERGIMFFVSYPGDWRTRDQAPRPQPWPASVR